MSVTVYGIPNCDTCRKARRWLDDQGVEHAFHDVRADGLDSKTIARWETWLGDIRAGEVLINRRSTTWRQLGADERQRKDVAGLLVEHPLLLKRPLLETGNTVTAGFSPERWLQALEG